MCPLKLHIKIVLHKPDGTAEVLADNEYKDLSEEQKRKILLYLEALNFGVGEKK